MNLSSMYNEMDEKSQNQDIVRQVGPKRKWTTNK